MASTIQATFLLFVCFAPIFSDALCPQGRDVVIHRDYKSGEQLCCQEIRCGPGQEAVVCTPDNPYSTSCRACPENTYQSEFTSSVDMMPCSMKQSCREGMKVEYDLSTVKDRKCVCDVEQGLCNSSRSRSQFCQLGNCSAGLQLNPDCSCSECKDGFFKETNGSSRCRRWRNCEGEGRETLVEGSSVADRVCGQQIDGSTRKNFPPSPFESISSNNTTSSDMMPKTTDMSGKNESTVANVGDNWTWISVIIACTVITSIGVVVGVILFAKCKGWRTSKNQSVENQPLPVIIRIPELGVETGANERETENSTLLNELVIQPNQNQTPEEISLLRAPDNQRDANNTILDQQQTLHTENIINETDTAVKEIAGSPNVIGSPNGSVRQLPDWKEKLKSCRVNLISSVCYSPNFISYLMINNTITQEMKEIIETKGTNRIDKLLDILPKRPPYAFRTLVLALVLTNQSHLAKDIDADMATEFDENRDYLEENHKEVLLSFQKSDL